MRWVSDAGRVREVTFREFSRTSTRFCQCTGRPGCETRRAFLRHAPPRRGMVGGPAGRDPGPGRQRARHHPAEAQGHRLPDQCIRSHGGRDRFGQRGPDRSGAGGLPGAAPRHRRGRRPRMPRLRGPAGEEFRQHGPPPEPLHRRAHDLLHVGDHRTAQDGRERPRQLPESARHHRQVLAGQPSRRTSTGRLSDTGWGPGRLDLPVRPLEHGRGDLHLGPPEAVRCPADPPHAP